MREIRPSGSEGGGARYSTGSPYPYSPVVPSGLATRQPRALLCPFLCGGVLGTRKGGQSAVGSRDRDSPSPAADRFLPTADWLLPTCQRARAGPIRCVRPVKACRDYRGPRNGHSYKETSPEGHSAVDQLRNGPSQRRFLQEHRPREMPAPGTPHPPPYDENGATRALAQRPPRSVCGRKRWPALELWNGMPRPKFFQKRFEKALCKLWSWNMLTLLSMKQGPVSRAAGEPVAQAGAARSGGNPAPKAGQIR